MKNAIITILACTSFASIVYAEQQSSRIRHASIEVGGTRLSLGMSKIQVKEKLAGQEITYIHEDEWMLGSFDKKELGPTIQFTNGRLSYADRNWVTYDNDIAEAMFGAVKTLNNEGFSRCNVTADDSVSPDLTAHRVWIECGEKTVLIIRRSFGGKSYNSVDERLGHMREVT